MKRDRLTKRKGFTLVELMLVIALIGILSVPVYALFYSQYVNTLRESYQTASQQEVRLAIDLMLNDLRRYEADNSIYDEDNNLIKLVEESSLKIKDGISYYMLNGSLMKNDIEIVQNVEEFLVSEESVGDFNIINIDLRVSVGQGKVKGTDIEAHYSYKRKLTNRR